MTNLEEAAISKLELAPGDVLVVHVKAILTREMAMRAREQFREFVPDGVKVLIIDGGTELSKLTRADIDARSA